MADDQKWLDKTWKFLTTIQEEFKKNTGRDLSECQLKIEKDHLHFSWHDDDLNLPWLRLSIVEKSAGDAYQILYEEFKKLWNFPAFPWGSLQGVRPAKLVHQKMNEGLTLSESVNYLSDKYQVESDRANLLGEIVAVQQEVLKGAEDSIGLYVGIPFCPSRCHYCSFPGEVIPKNEKEIVDFWDYLKPDIRAAAQWQKESGMKVSTLYIGGGTPTSLPLVLFEELLELLKQEFDLTSLKEFSLEAGRPETLSKEKLQAAFNAGVRRISVNPQTMHQRTLDQIGRAHTVEEILEGVKLAREIGFPIINMDLIAGLPGETLEDFSESLQQVIALRPENITVHSLALKKGSQWLDRNQSLPTADLMKQMIEKAQSEITGSGWRPYYLYRQKNSPGRLENIGYSLVGAESLYNIQMMEETHSIIGMGPGSATKKKANRGRIYNYHFPKERRAYQTNLPLYLERRQHALETEEE